MNAPIQTPRAERARLQELARRKELARIAACYRVASARLSHPIRPDAYTVDALIDGGLTFDQAESLLVAASNVVPERPFLSLTGRARGSETKVYIWGPDAVELLADAQWEVTTRKREDAKVEEQRRAEEKRGGAR